MLVSSAALRRTSASSLQKFFTQPLSSISNPQLRRSVMLKSPSPLLTFYECRCQRRMVHRRFLHDKKSKSESVEDETTHEEAASTSGENKPSPSLRESFVQFEEGHSVIQDAVDEQWNPVTQPYHYDPDERLNLTRGKNGVFDVEELVQLLEEERAFDTCVISIPNEMKYADYLVLVTARSPKHLQAIATFVRRVFKKKDRKPSDVLPAIEGGPKIQDWAALDLGNIALHIFTEEKRLEVDLETLWTVGPQFDDLTNQKDPIIVALLGNFSNTAQLDTVKN